ncbi:MAG: peptidylprolyl isomerase [Lysobacteraceae bacterium SCN 69-123]|uniref:peptidylprolyl isomerase n=1 Tax=Stenotrophomonas acidaminiphila TaxID=128780 RepID=UPI00086900C2|nr:peptidylprolyl isomerase [Stenotrophomonas acidaminiphila]MBN8802975.1 peptidylprolyl isomerase [Stenotrophomonas acidaminiphila]MDF9442874.1 peptidylprolyl isomerase [Stenotrophomonas acidaminiphila]ODU41366.1 MAG: peptidylprolyl isomerase [Xanthomonadaceae bacterium SCN 69-123]OJY76499.1 MAG: peptidylprolyl isomerase [Stenotrophomonas sp. 69-14]
MTLRPTLLALALMLSPLPALAADAPAKYRSAQEILATSPDSDWHVPAADNLLYMDLDGGRVIIELAPGFAPEHAGNIRTLAREGFWNGTSIYRSQDNFVVQFGDADADDPARARPLGSARTHLPAEFQRPARGLAFTALPDRDGWAAKTGFVGDFAVASDGEHTWLAHCYGAVGAGRNNDEDSSIGAELYVVTGQSPRQLDRNITLVGRVLKGMELLSTIKRGPEPMGFYEDTAQRTPIRSIRLASAVPAAERTPLRVLRTDSRTFADMVEARRNRRDDFYKRAAGHIDLCNIPLPVR